jgi:hypothetical protein
MALSFSAQELDEVLALTKADTAPGPDGFPVSFFKSCWSWLKPLLLNILNEFALGRLDIARLNFGVLSLIPKVPGADSIKLFRPIALINVIFKFISKAYAIRLTPIAHRTISFVQTAFIKGRQILDGALALHEILDELHVSHQPAIILKLDFEKAYDRVNWAFLRTVLTQKGFESGNIHRLMHLVSGGQTAICINGEVGPFFRNKRGVRQGDPISPLLFNFMADALSALIDAAARAGHLRGVVPHLIQGGVTHLQYADDTILLLALDDMCIANLKFILITFEILYGLKINFLKSEVIVMGAAPTEQARVANALNCKEGAFPFTYLGFPMADRALTMSDWVGLIGSVGHRVDPWQGRFMSSAARLTLINSCLTSLTIFSMGLFLLADGTHAGFDRHLARFFWEGVGEKRKFHWVNWPEVCRPKDQGGLGIINTWFLNIALMTKWIWRLFDPAEQNSLWFKLLQAKYFNTDNIFAATSQGGSQFWRSINKIKHFFKLGARYTVENGEKVCFWTDWWVGEAPLAIRFPRLFDICSYQAISVAQAIPVSPASLHFCRSFGHEDRELWISLVNETSAVSLSSLPDSVSWGLESNGKFSVSSLYRKITPSLPHESMLWSAKLPLKIKIFLWQLAKGRLPSNAQINRRHGASDGNCALCGHAETVDHIFFSFHLACFAWSGIREALGCSGTPILSRISLGSLTLFP